MMIWNQTSQVDDTCQEEPGTAHVKSFQEIVNSLQHTNNLSYLEVKLVIFSRDHQNDIIDHVSMCQKIKECRNWL
jgi:hypothetical protein